MSSSFTVQWGSLLLGIVVTVLLGGALWWVTRRAAAAEAARVAAEREVRRQTPAGQQYVAQQNAPPTDAVFDDFFRDGINAASHGVNSTTVNINGRTLTGAEAEEYLRSHNLNDTVQEALAQALGSTHAYSTSHSTTTTIDAQDRDLKRFSIQPPQKKTVGGVIRTSLAWVAGFALLFTFSIGVKSCFQSAFLAGAAGEVTASGPKIGHWTMKVDRCQAGSKRSFDGVQFYSKEDTRLAIWMMDNPVSGSIAKINRLNSKDAYNFTADQCRVMSGSASFDGVNFNDVREMKGSYDIDCRVDDDHVYGHMEAKACH